MIDANTGADIINPQTGEKGGWRVGRNDMYSLMPCTKAADEAQRAYDAAELAFEKAEAEWIAAGAPTSGPLRSAYLAARSALNAQPGPAPTEANCAQRGGGGDFLSNASAYRNTLMRDVFGLKIPAGHIHTPVMSTFGPGSNGLITDSTFESYREALIAQTRNLIVAVATSLAQPAPASTSP